MGLDCRNNVQVQSPVTLMPHGEKIEATGPLRWQYTQMVWPETRHHQILDQ